MVPPQYSVPSAAEVRRILQENQADRDAHAQALERQLAVSEDTLTRRFLL